MFENVGRKIQGLAKASFFLCLIVCGFAFLSSFFSSPLRSIIIILLAIILSFISCLLLYGFGIIVEVAENSLTISAPTSPLLRPKNYF